MKAYLRRVRGAGISLGMAGMMALSGCTKQTAEVPYNQVEKIEQQGHIVFVDNFKVGGVYGKIVGVPNSETAEACEVEVTLKADSLLGLTGAERAGISNEVYKVRDTCIKKTKTDKIVDFGVEIIGTTIDDAFD